MNVLKIAAFSDGEQGGNPAGVVIAEALPPEALMQRIAADVGFSETAFAARLNERHALAVPQSHGQLQVAGDALWTAIGDVIAARWSLFDDEAIANLLRDGGQPGVEKLALMIEVEDFQVAGDLSADDAKGIVLISEPGRDMVGGGKLLLELLPGGDGRTLLLATGR